MKQVLIILLPFITLVGAVVVITVGATQTPCTSFWQGFRAFYGVTC